MVVADTDGEVQHVLHGKPDIVLENIKMDATIPTCTSEERFVCNQCLESFGDRDTLFKHVKMEHQQHVQHVHARRRFKCEQCQKTFKSMTGLRNHARTHSVFFEMNADILQNDSVRASNSEEQVNTTSTCTTNSSTITAETEYIGVDTTLAQQRNNGDEELGSRDKCDGHNSGRQKSQRRRSGIPLPVRRSLQAESRPVSSVFCLGINSPIELKNDIEQGNTKIEQAQKTCKSTVMTPTGYMTRKSRRLTRTIGMEVTQDVSQKVQPLSLFKSRTPKSCTRTPEPKTKAVTKTKLELKSPFGTKYRTVVGSPVTPRSRSKSNGRTPRNGRSTPNNGRRTPVNIRTTRSAKKDTPTGKVYNCKKCGKSFMDSAKLDVHFTLHIRDTPKKCGIPKYALKKTPNAQRMDTRLFTENCTGDNKTGFSCKQCGRTYDTKKYLDAHAKIHEINAPFSCEYCDKKFRFMSSLKAHSFVHQGESRDLINNVTSDAGNKTAPTNKLTLEFNNGGTAMKFNIFSVLETNENPLEDFLNDLPFTCKTCSFKTHAPAEFLNHMKTHSKSGRFTCRQCCKSYKLQSNLKLHEKIHTISKLKQILIGNTNNKTIK